MQRFQCEIVVCGITLGFQPLDVYKYNNNPDKKIFPGIPLSYSSQRLSQPLKNLQLFLKHVCRNVTLTARELSLSVTAAQWGISTGQKQPTGCL